MSLALMALMAPTRAPSGYLRHCALVGLEAVHEPAQQQPAAVAARPHVRLDDGRLVHGVARQVALPDFPAEESQEDITKTPATRR